MNGFLVDVVKEVCFRVGRVSASRFGLTQCHRGGFGTQAVVGLNHDTTVVVFVIRKLLILKWKSKDWCQNVLGRSQMLLNRSFRLLPSCWLYNGLFTGLDDVHIGDVCWYDFGFGTRSDLSQREVPSVGHEKMSKAAKAVDCRGGTY